MDSTVNCDVTLRAEKGVKRERLGTRLDERLIRRKKSLFSKISGYVWTGLPWFFLKFSPRERERAALREARDNSPHLATPPVG